MTPEKTTQRPGNDFPGVGVGMVIRRDDRFLLYRRYDRRKPAIGISSAAKWTSWNRRAMPQSVKPWRKPGLLIADAEFLGLTEQIIAADRQHWVSLLYLATEFSGEARLMEPDKLSTSAGSHPTPCPNRSQPLPAAFALLR